MVQRPPPERKGSGEESLREEDQSIGRFKSLTKRLLAVNRDELAEQEEKYKKNNESKD